MLWTLDKTVHLGFFNLSSCWHLYPFSSCIWQTLWLYNFSVVKLALCGHKDAELASELWLSGWQVCYYRVGKCYGVSSYIHLYVWSQANCMWLSCYYRKTQYIYCAVLAAKSHRTAACTSVVNLLSCRVRRINATHRKVWKF